MANLPLPNRTVSMEIMEALEIPKADQLTLSNGWLASFKERHNLRAFKRHGEAASVDMADVKPEQERIRAITDDYASKDIYNADETGLFYA